MNTYAYDENGRRRWALIAGAVLAIVVLLAVAFIGGRASAPSAGGSSTQTVRVRSGPGPARVVNGVPVGYAHTQAGAVAAATNYLAVIGGPLLFTSDKYLNAVATMAAPESRSKLQQHADGDMTAASTLISSAQGRRAVRRVVPLAYSVSHFDAEGAQVSIWAESLIAVDGVISFREGWSTTVLTVEWSGDDWKLSDVAAPGPDSFSPVPTPIEAPGQTTVLPPQLSTYRSYLSDVPT